MILWFLQRHRDRYRTRPVVLIAGRHTNSGGKDTCCRAMAQAAPTAGCMILFNNLEVILL
nr:MAG TPA: CobW-like protein [Caudoviricetes sp.]